MGVCAGSFAALLAYQAVEDVQRVEQEMRIHLMLELYIPILCHIGLFPFFMHLVPCCNCIVDHIDDAQKLKNHTLYIDREQLGEPDEGYYICDLIGCSVKTDEGEILGEVIDVFKTGSNDVYVVRTEEGKQILLPVIDEVILSVDVEAELICVHLLEGLVD